jgi:hypothetical protein
MRFTQLQRALSAAVTALASTIAACSSKPASLGPGDDGGDASSGDDTGGSSNGCYSPTVPGVGRSYAPTWDAVWNEIVRTTCATEFCHAGSADFMVLLGEEQGYGAIVGVPAQGPMCAPTGLLRIAPYDAGASLLYLKITRPPCGNKMPFLPGGPTLCPADIDQIARWITCGAPDGDGGCEAGAEGTSDAAPDGADAAQDGGSAAADGASGAAGDAGVALDAAGDHGD